jgi:DMSO/TMAO reductase YedYZ molybdopterin-dependent catalytic subunit
MLRRATLKGALGLGSALLLQLGGPAARAESAGVEVLGQVRTPLHLDVAALAAFAAEHQSSARVTRRVDEAERSTTLRGVRLAAVLERAGLHERDRFDWRKTVVLATATDRYRAAFSWPELVNTEAGRQVLLVYERDGAPLDAREGPIALHAVGDLRSGPRHVRNLARIEVRILRD